MSSETVVQQRTRLTFAKGHSSKVCRKCEVLKPLADFRLVNTKRSNHRRSECNGCETAYKKLPSYKQGQSEYSKRRRRNPVQQAVENQRSKVYGRTTKGRATRLFLAAKRRATVLKLEFDLALGRIEFALLVGKCERTGIPFDLNSPVGTNFNPFAPSLDKKDPFGGYTNSNIQVVCNAYNLGKSQMTDDQFIEFCRTVVNYNVK